MKKLFCVILSVVLVSLPLTAFAANPVPASEEWLASDTDRTVPDGKVVMSPGKDDFSRRFTWLSSKNGDSFEYYTPSGEKIEPVVEKLPSAYGFFNTVSLENLEQGNYEYTAFSDGEICGPYRFTVSNSDKSTVMFCSDPQLGRSGDNSEEAVMNDAYGWERTLNKASDMGAELFVCAGDQVNDGFSKSQYAAFLAPQALKTTPIAAAAGNHDFYSSLYLRFFGNRAGVSAAGGDFYFKKGEALFIFIDSNNVVLPVHESAVAEAVAAYPDAPWRIIVMHHSAYSAGGPEATNILAGKPVTLLADKYGIDLVLSGHDHTYARTAAMKNGKAAEGGTVYLQAGSASGGKCTNFDEVPADTVFSQYLDTASFSILTITADTLSVDSYETDTGVVFDSFTLSKVSPAKGQSTLAKLFFSFILMLRNLFSLNAPVC